MISEQKLLADLQSASADVRFAAWRQAGEAPASVIPQLGRLAGSPQPGIAKAAREALAEMVHAVGKDPAAPRRAAVVDGLIGLTGPAYALAVRIHAFRLLSHIAGEEAVPAVARQIHNPELAEEVVYCLERIPGPAAIEALTAAYPKSPDSFKPPILAALGHRRAAEAVPLCLEAMSSPDPDIALASVKAFARIGRPLPAGRRFPEPGRFSAWGRIELLDSMLRYADAQAVAGNSAETFSVYRALLAQPEEHWQCAAAIGLARLGTAEAASVLLPLLDSPDRRVRITARQAWQAMADRS